MTISTTQETNMTEQEFDVIMAFTLAVKRGPKPDAMVIEATKRLMIDGDKRLPGYGCLIRKRAHDLGETVEFHGALLRKYADGDKFGAYMAKHPRRPEVQIWNAAITGDKAHLNNSQKVCVGVLIKRIKMWDGFAERLNKAE